MKLRRIFQLAALCGFVVESLAQSPTNWVVRAPSPPAGQLGAITFNDGRFVLADTTGGMLISSDGRNWTRTAVPSNPVKIIYAEGKYVAAAVTLDGAAGEIFTSTDGITWTSRHNMSGIRDLEYLNGLFVLVEAQRLMTSPDGETWSPTVDYMNWRWEDVAYGNGAYVVVGTFNTGLDNQPQVLHSTNGVDWTRYTPPGGNAALHAVAFGNGIFVANGDNGISLTSTDGINWTAHQGVQDPPVSISEMGFGNGYFLASSSPFSIDTFIYYSTNGIDWAAGCLRCVGPSSAPFYADSIAFGNGQFITANRDGSIYTSTDPRNWSVLRNGLDLNAVTYGASTFVAVGAGSTVWSSPDGRDWTYAFGGKKHSAPPDLFGVTFGEGLFVTVGGPGPYLATSPDGLTWTEQERLTLGDSETLRAVAYGNGIFVAAGEQFTGPGTTTVPKIVISSNGSNWFYPEFTANSTGFFGVGYGNGTFVVVGNQGAILTSTDGSNWTARASGTSQTLRAVTFHLGRFLVAGDSGTMLTSSDGVNWGPSSPTSFSNRGLGSGTGVLAVGNFQDDGRLHWSNDGLGWPGNSTSFPEILNGAAWGEVRWVVVGNGGLILQAGAGEARLSNPRFVNGAFEMTIETEPGLAGYTILGSTNLTDWIQLAFVPSPPPTYVFRDETSNTTPLRFYRVVP